MDEAKCKCGNAIITVARAKDGIVGFVEELSLRFGLFDDYTQIYLQDDNLIIEMTMSSNMGK